MNEIAQQCQRGGGVHRKPQARWAELGPQGSTEAAARLLERSEK